MSGIREEIKKLPGIAIAGLATVGLIVLGGFAAMLGKKIYDNRVGILHYLSMPVVWFILASAVVVGILIWYFSNQMAKVEGEEDEVDSPPPPDQQKTEVFQKFKARIKEVWAERKALAIPFIILYVILNITIGAFFWTQYKFLVSVPGFFAMQLLVIAILSVLAFFKETKVLQGIAIAIVVIAIAGFARNLYLSFPKHKTAVTEKLESERLVFKSLPSDTSFKVTVIKDQRDVTISFPTYYSVRFNLIDYTHCFDVTTESGEKYEFCPGRQTEIPENFHKFTISARMPKTRVVVRLCDWRITDPEDGHTCPKPVFVNAIPEDEQDLSYSEDPPSEVILTSRGP